MSERKPDRKLDRPRDGKPAGRPPWQPDKATLEQVEHLAKLGLTQDEIAHTIGIGATTFYYKKIDYPELDAAVKRGKAAGIQIASTQLLEMVQIGNIEAIKTFLKLCHGRSERTETQHSGAVETTSKIEWVVQPIMPGHAQGNDANASKTNTEKNKKD